jgi:hypothetical protein
LISESVFLAEYRSGSGSNLDPGFSKIAIYLSLGFIKNVQATGEWKPSAIKREHPALQNMKFMNFFLFLWVI